MLLISSAPLRLPDISMSAYGLSGPYSFQYSACSQLTQSSSTRPGTRSNSGNDSNLLIVFYVQIMPDDFVMQLHRF